MKREKEDDRQKFYENKLFFEVGSSNFYIKGGCKVYNAVDVKSLSHHER